MKKSILTFAAAAAISGSLGIHASAKDVKVKDGDTLWGLSQKHNVSVDDMKSLNNLSSDIIHPQQILKVSNEEYYTIKKGDTLWHIADRFNVAVGDLKKWNQLRSDIIHAGQKLVIHPSGGSATPAVAKAKPAAAKKAAVTKVRPAAKKAAVVTASPKPAKKVVKGVTNAELTVSATGYTAYCEGCSGVTATGVDLRANPDAKVIAVDPSVIPLGTKVYVEGYGYATAQDTGGAIKGNKIDLFFADKQDALNWGRRQVTVKILK
ncbi:LysM peptidoglycan-binding domain-containing protein [Peribacillus sp. SCS-155]|uniref:3D domain-containing protein n=1 Tax=Peribacillus sedimenti TaxID=3115297 RepID=UPI003906C504